MRPILTLLAILSVLSLVLAQTSLPFPSGGASVAQGASVYSQSCASCHGTDGEGTATASLNFAKPDWTTSYAPVDVASAALGQSAGHTAALTDTPSAWQATAYVWTLPLAAHTVQEGQAEVTQAADKLKKGGLALLITKGDEIKELEDADWVMQQTEADLVKVISDVAAAEYNALNAEHQQALIDYIYASHFELPPGW